MDRRLGSRRWLVLQVVSVLLGAAVGIAAWWAWNEAGEGGARRLPTVLWGPDGSMEITGPPVGTSAAGHGTEPVGPFPLSPEQCREARALFERMEREYAARAESLASNAASLPEEWRLFFEYELQWWHEEAPGARQWLDAGCPEDGVRGEFRLGPDGPVVGVRLFVGADSALDAMIARADELPVELQRLLRSLGLLEEEDGARK